MSPRRARTPGHRPRRNLPTKTLFDVRMGLAASGAGSRPIYTVVFPLLVALSFLLTAAGQPTAPNVQEGLASFYGARSQGKETASGEKFDKNDLTAAHPSYPGGTVVRVTNLENSRSVNVRIIDRGPAKKARRDGVIIDLSRAAARPLEFTDDGRARVRVEVVKKGGG